MITTSKDIFNKKVLWFLLLLLVVSFSYAFINYSGYIPNRQYMTTIFLMQDVSFLKNDFYVQDYAGFNFRYFFAKIFLLSDKLFNNFDITMPFLSALTIFFISLNIYLLAYFYFKDKRYSVLISVMSIFLVHFNLGGNALITPYLTPNMMSSIFVLFSLNLLLRGKTIACYLSLGVATLLHPMIGLLMYGTFVFVQIFPYILNFELKIILINLLKSLSYFIISLFVLVPLIINNLRTAVPDKNALIAYTIGIFKHWSHTSPFSWPIERFIGYGVFLFIALAIALKYIRENRHKLYLYGYLAITGLTLLGATIFVEIWPLAIVAKVQLFRVLVFLSAFAYIVIIKYIYDCIFKSKYITEKFIIMIIPMLFFSRVTIFIGLISIFILLIYEKYKSYIYKKLKIILKQRFYSYLFLFIIIIFFLLFLGNYLTNITIKQQDLRFFIYRLSYLIFISTIYLLLFLYLLNTKIKKWLWFMIPFIVISGSISFSLRDISEESSCSFLYKPAQFIKQNSKEDSLFLIPLDWDVFRLCARRAVVVDLGTVFTDKAVVEWHTRILEVTKQKELIGPRDELQLKIGYHSLTDGDIRSLQKKYKFDYAAFEKEFLAQNYMFPVFYEDEKVIIYKTS